MHFLKVLPFVEEVLGVKGIYSRKQMTHLVEDSELGTFQAPDYSWICTIEMRRKKVSAKIRHKNMKDAPYLYTRVYTREFSDHKKMVDVLMNRLCKAVKKEEGVSVPPMEK